MDYLIIAVAVLSGLYFHWWLFVRIRRWADRDLALSMAGNEPAKRDFMLGKLAEAQRLGVKKRQLEAWLQDASTGYAVTRLQDKN
ncbi:hypothetical protein ACS8E9_13995 [Pseudomonas neustonica]|uniref:hypothetical protein n=1 Tax=Pseudomonas neustonica TaxID=2487346 RepID=UPI003F44B18F